MRARLKERERCVHPIRAHATTQKSSTAPSSNDQTHKHSSGRLSFLLACDLADATAGVGAVVAVVQDEHKRQRQNAWFLEARGGWWQWVRVDGGKSRSFRSLNPSFMYTNTQLVRNAASPGAVEGVLKRLWDVLGLDEKGACVSRCPSQCSFLQ